MDKKEKDKLLESPMFQLSLSSKELFHSNFLYWISKISKEMFKHVIAQLFENAGKPIDLGEWPEKFDVMREHKHYDLCVVDKNTEYIWLVIENKVKSIPDKVQLDQYYTDTPDSKHLLLSLSTKFPNKVEINASWDIADYKILSDVLNECVKNNHYNLSEYQLALIVDYAEMIKNLHVLQESWQDINEFITPADLQLKDLRINDLQEKHRFSNMYARIKQEIETELNVTIKSSSRKEIFGDKNTSQQTHYKPGDRNVFLGWGMTRSQGLLEAKILVKKNVLLLVQIQGNQYRHCVELYKSRSNAKENWEKYSNDPSTAWFISTLNGNMPFERFAGSPEILEIRPDTTREKKQYNKYGDEFLYKSITIPETTTVDEVIKMLISDCENILKHVDLGSSVS